MTLYEFLLQLGFWQWVGVIVLAAIAATGCQAILESILEVLRSRKKP